MRRTLQRDTASMTVESLSSEDPSAAWPSTCLLPPWRWASTPPKRIRFEQLYYVSLCFLVHALLLVERQIGSLDRLQDGHRVISGKWRRSTQQDVPRGKRLLLEGLGNHQNWLLAITCCIDPRDSLSKADSTHDDPDAPHVTQLVVVTCKNLTVVGTTGRSRVHLLFA